MKNAEITFTARNPEEPEDWAAHEPDRSTILFQLIEGDSYMFPKGAGVDFHEFQSEGKAAFWENEGSMLQDAVAGMLNIEDCTPGWFVMGGFEAHYTSRYEGDVDCDYHYETLRPARWSDMRHFGLLAPWWVRALLWMGFDLEVPAHHMDA